MWNVQYFYSTTQLCIYLVNIIKEVLCFTTLISLDFLQSQFISKRKNNTKITNENENKDKVGSFIPMQIYRNSQLLKTKCLQMIWVSYGVHNFCMPNITKEHCVLPFMHTFCVFMYSSIVNKENLCSTV